MKQLRRTVMGPVPESWYKILNTVGRNEFEDRGIDEGGTVVDGNLPKRR